MPIAFASLDWPKILERFARAVNPLLGDLLDGYRHDWVTAQSEYSTDLVFAHPTVLRGLYPRFVSHCTQCFGATEVMCFL